MIEFSDLKLQFEDSKKSIFENINYVVKYGVSFGGHHEKQLKEFVSNLYKSHVQLTNSGTSALLASLLCLDLPKNSRILLPTMTYAATAQAILNVGCIPTFIDIDNTWLMDLNHLEKIYDLYKNECSAVIAVDLYGQGVDINKLKSWCDNKNLKLIIDAAQSFGLTNENYDQTIADAICLSFSAYKNFGGLGGGGAVVSKKLDPKKLSAICIQGKTVSGPDGRIDYQGSNFRITGIQSALVAANIPLYNDRFDKKVKVIKKYISKFEKYRDLIKFPEIAFANNFNWYVFPISPQNYTETCELLNLKNIDFGHHYKFPLHKENFVKNYSNHSCPYGETLANKIISLPTHPHLRDSDVEEVIQTVISAL